MENLTIRGVVRPSNSEFLSPIVLTRLGQFESLKIPFGLKTAPSTFQRFINTAFSELIRSGDVIVYLDDFMIATKTLDEQIEMLRKVFDVMVRNKIKLRIDKCYFMYTSIEYLGYEVSDEGVRPSKKGLEAIEGFQLPRTLVQVHGFLGLCQYFRKFIEGFALMAKPLYDLLRRDAEFRFGERELRAFESLKRKLIAKLLLGIYSPRDKIELHCDNSSKGFGAALMQQKSHEKFHPIFFFSKIFKIFKHWRFLLIWTP